MTAFQASLLNEIVGPVMRGPSSSHTAAPHAIGLAARQLALGGTRTLRSATVRFDPSGSFAAVYAAQKSDHGFAAGLLGLGLDDPAYPDALQLARDTLGLRIEVVPLVRNDHPNAVELLLASADPSGRVRTDRLEAVSTGGGSFKLHTLNGADLGGWSGERWLEVAVDGELRQAAAARLPVNGRAPFALNVADVLAQGLPAGRCGLLYEAAVLDVSPEAALEHFGARLDVMLGAVARGMAQRSAMRFLQPAAARLAMMPPRLVSPAQWLATAGAVAVMEHDVAGGLVVAAPTAGSAGILPGVLHALAAQGVARPVLIDVLCTAALVGGIFAAHGTFAAECGGCAVETGAAGAMAAAGLITAEGGSLEAALDAAALVLLNTAGLACDPIDGEVEIPCHARNVAGVAHAFAAAAAVLGGFSAGLPFDELAEAVVRVGASLPAELRCTAKGGCTTTPTALRLVSAGCRGGGCV